MSTNIMPTVDREFAGALAALCIWAGKDRFADAIYAALGVEEQTGEVGGGDWDEVFDGLPHVTVSLDDIDELIDWTSR